MRYIIIILFGLSLTAVALAVSPSKDSDDTPKGLQQKYQKTIGKDVCDPKKATHLPLFFN